MCKENSSTTSTKLRRSQRILGSAEKSLLVSKSAKENVRVVTNAVGLRRSPRFSTTDGMVIESSKAKQLVSTPKQVGKKRRNAHEENFRSPLTSIENTSACHLEKGKNVSVEANGRVKKRCMAKLKFAEEVGGAKQPPRSVDCKNRKKGPGLDEINKKEFHVLDEGVTPEKGNEETSISLKDAMRKVERKTTSMISPLMISRAGREKKTRNTNKGLPITGVNSCVQGWTLDQESALQRAYFAAKPSPHFWKNVAKMVPGKSAQECFDKVHSDSITPPQPQRRSRARKATSSPLGHFSFSASKLLEPAELDSKRPRSKQKKCLAHKTARHLLQKHTQEGHGYEADVFSTLEPAMGPLIQSPQQTKLLSTPACSLKKNGFCDDYQERSSSTHKKAPLSRFGDSCSTTLVSPAVLKPIRNRALHEKYIDQLHCREAKRIAGDRRNLTAKENKINGNVQTMDVVKAARNALVSDARDMIIQFQHLQANPTSKDEDFTDQDDDCVSGGDEGEEEP